MSTWRRRGRADFPTVVASIGDSWPLLSRRSRRSYAVIVAGQMATGLLDVLGVALIGLMSLAATSAVGGSDLDLPDLPGLDRWAGQDPLQTAAVLAFAAAAALIARSLAYGVLLRLNYRLLARCQVESTTRLLGRFLRRPILEMQEMSSQAAAYALTTGSSSAISGLLGSLSVVLTDATLLVLLGGGLFVITPSVTIATAVYLALVFTAVHFSLARWSSRTAVVSGTAGISGTVSVQESIGLHRELWSLGRLGAQYERTRDILETGARARATQSLISQIPRVVYDAALVVGALLLAAWQLQVSTLSQALTTLLVFLAAASRVIPSLLRLNGQLIQMRFAAGQARPTYELAQRLAEPAQPGWREPSLTPADTLSPRVGDRGSSVSVRDVTFAYPASDEPVLNQVSFDMPSGTSTAIVGPTGGGKSTLADVVVGLLVPSHGEVRVDGEHPLEAITANPGRVAYVPQRVTLIDGTVRENVAVAMGAQPVDEGRLWESLARAHLDTVVSALPDGLDTRLGEHALRLSGGQRQRLGLARALYSDPALLVLDEATSALDAETERAIADGLAGLHGRVTVLVIAHRLAAVKDADQVIYLENGRIAAQGTFDELMRSSASFARQVEILSMPEAMTPLTDPAA